MFEDADNLADLFRGGLPYYILITLPILIICSSNPVLASSEFNVQRMSQYDLHGVPYGESKNWFRSKGCAYFYPHCVLFLSSFFKWTRDMHSILSKWHNIEVKWLRANVFIFHSIAQVAEHQRLIWRPNRCTHGPHRDIVSLPGESWVRLGASFNRDLTIFRAKTHLRPFWL